MAQINTDCAGQCSVTRYSRKSAALQCETAFLPPTPYDWSSGGGRQREQHRWRGWQRGGRGTVIRRVSTLSPAIEFCGGAFWEEGQLNRLCSQLGKIAVQPKIALFGLSMSTIVTNIKDPLYDTKHVPTSQCTHTLHRVLHAYNL